MSDFTDLKSLYEHLESEAYAYEYASLIVQDFQKLGKLAEANQDLDTSQKCKWEAAFFDFNLDGNELVAQRIYQDEQGKSYSYPDPNMLDAEVLDYVETRLDQTSHPLLRSRYASILWCSSRKHNKYAEVAISSNLQIVDYYLSNQTYPVHSGHLVEYILRSALNIAKAAYKRNKDKQRQVTEAVLDAFKRLDNRAGGCKIRMLELVYERDR